MFTLDSANNDNINQQKVFKTSHEENFTDVLVVKQIPQGSYGNFTTGS